MKMRPYLKEYLDKLNFGTPEHQTVVTDLLKRAQNSESLSYSESEYVFRIISVSHGETP